MALNPYSATLTQAMKREMSYTHHFFIRTFINYLMLITLFWRKDSDKNYNG